MADLAYEWMEDMRDTTRRVVQYLQLTSGLTVSYP